MSNRWIKLLVLVGLGVAIGCGTASRTQGAKLAPNQTVAPSRVGGTGSNGLQPDAFVRGEPLAQAPGVAR
ncbi:MAG TPA: hypothetical protein VGL81_11125 [Polyangiaceae bacterium]|jgi:hypothetical protein